MAYTTTTMTTPLNSALEKAKKQKQELVKASKKELAVFKKEFLIFKQDPMRYIKQPEFKTTTIYTAGGAITLGAVGGAFGTAAGVVVGGAAGLIPALFTFGLSIPAGAVVGGGSGCLVGSGTGALVGGAAGFGGYKYRVQIKDGVIYVKKSALTKAGQARGKAMALVDTANAKLAKYKADGKAQVTLIVDKTKALPQRAKAFSTKKYAEAVELAKKPTVQATTASAAAGGVAGGVTGGSVGLVAGAALGVVPALFTFGLSIPIGATIGLTTGAVGGSAVGAVGCGTAGYYGYTQRKQIGDGVQSAMKKTSESVDYVKAKAKAKAGQVSDSVAALLSGGTGATA